MLLMRPRRPAPLVVNVLIIAPSWNRRPVANRKRHNLVRPRSTLLRLQLFARRMWYVIFVPGCPLLQTRRERRVLPRSPRPRWPLLL